MTSIITAVAVADSVAADTGIRLTTLAVTYPRFIHSEMMTHRVFSRNASSSRAIPVKKTIDMVVTRMAEPVHWGQNQPGMQAREELQGWKRAAARLVWRTTGHIAVLGARLMAALGAHKQIVNRMIEPWSHITVVISSTEWDNFFALRDHKDADPTIQVVARCMRVAMDASRPRTLQAGEWHLPFLSPLENLSPQHDMLKRLSAARCARTSYLTHDKQRPDRAQDYKLFDRLAGAAPQHLSPTEHQATPSGDTAFHANFRGWKQFRQEVDLAA